MFGGSPYFDTYPFGKYKQARRFFQRCFSVWPELVPSKVVAPPKRGRFFLGGPRFDQKQLPAVFPPDRFGCDSDAPRGASSLALEVVSSPVSPFPFAFSYKSKVTKQKQSNKSKVTDAFHLLCPFAFSNNGYLVFVDVKKHKQSNSTIFDSSNCFVLLMGTWSLLLTLKKRGHPKLRG